MKQLTVDVTVSRMSVIVFSLYMSEIHCVLLVNTFLLDFVNL